MLKTHFKEIKKWTTRVIALTGFNKLVLFQLDYRKIDNDNKWMKFKKKT